MASSGLAKRYRARSPRQVLRQSGRSLRRDQPTVNGCQRLGQQRDCMISGDSIGKRIAVDDPRSTVATVPRTRDARAPCASAMPVENVSRVRREPLVPPRRLQLHRRILRRPIQIGHHVGNRHAAGRRQIRIARRTDERLPPLPPTARKHVISEHASLGPLDNRWYGRRPETERDSAGSGAASHHAQ